MDRLRLWTKLATGFGLSNLAGCFGVRYYSLLGVT